MNEFSIENIKKLLKNKDFRTLEKKFNNIEDLNSINYYVFSLEEKILFFNNIILKKFKEDINLLISPYELYKKYNEIFLNFIPLIYKNINDIINIIEFNELFLFYINDYLKNVLSKKTFNSKEELYEEFKNLNNIVNLYSKTANKLLNNDFYLKKIHFNNFKQNILNLLKSYIDLNKEIVDNNSNLIFNSLYFKHDGFKHLLPAYFYILLNILVFIYNIDIKEIEYKIDVKLIDLIETIENNPFYNLNLSNDKKIFIFITFFYTYNTLIFSDLNYYLTKKKKEVNIYNINIHNNLIETIFLSTNLSNINKFLYSNYLTINFIYFIKSKIISFLSFYRQRKEKRIEKLLENLKLFFKYNYNLEVKEDFIFNREIENEKIPLYFYIIFFLLYLLIEKEKFNIENNINNNNLLFDNLYFRKILKTKIIKNYINEQKLFYFEINTIYSFIKIFINNEEYMKILNEIIYSIKYYKVKNYEKYQKILNKKFLLSNDIILYFVLKTKLISTEELLEIINIEEIKKSFKTNKLLVIELLENIKNIYVKENKMLISYVIEKFVYEEKEQIIINKLKFMGINFETDFIIKLL